MDSQFLYFASILTLFIFVFMSHKILTKKSKSTPNLPPGPWKLPIIGNIHNLVGSLPHHRLRELSTKYGPLMHLKLGEISTIIVSSAECAKQVMKTHDLIFSSRPPIQASTIMSYNNVGIAFAPYGDYWRQLRKICTLELLSSKSVQSFQPIRDEEVTNLIKWITSKEGSSINLTKEVFSTISTITSRTAFGKKCEENTKFISLVREAVKVAGGFNLGDLYPSYKWLQNISGLKPKLEKLHQQADIIMQKIINEHREVNKLRANEDQEVEEDLVDVLLKQNCLSDDSVKAVILDVYGGGSETSATTIAWAMAEMIKNPRIMEKVQAEVREVFDKEKNLNGRDIEKLTYLKYVVKETLRLHPPAPLLLPRECGQDCEINGYNIPFKSKIIVNAWAIGRDPNYWVDPEIFYPERFVESCVDYKGNNFEFIPFGAGRRMCPGLTFGLINVEFPLAMLLYHFDWKLPNGVKNEDLDMSETFGSAVTRKDDLYLIPITYHL
ncbi:cytochrome P450 71D9-like [Cicer arietinum]|uniref:Cytochrome P450 71D9-like n=1 Tax=Cicer arietinum TaxID=3827 RepID=A0A1S2YLZ1_CICAR|nr:cytochrome P450 71D9-like [Cicer arietinum]